MLPNAATAGLASSYKESYEIHTQKATKASGYFFRSIFALFLLAIIFLALSLTSKDSTNNLLAPFLPFLKTLPLFLPATWLVLSQQRTMRIHQRMAEEYLHKFNLAQSYTGFQNATAKQKEINLDSILSEMLLGITLEAKSRNPSITMDAEKHNNDHPMSQFLKNLFSKKKMEEGLRECKRWC